MIVVVDGNNNSVIDTIPVGSYPHEVAVNSVTNKIYVSNFGHLLEPDTTVSVIDGITNTVVNTIQVGTNPVGVAVNSVTNKIYVSNYASNTISVINGITDNVISITSISHPYSVAVNSVTNIVYVTNIRDDMITLIDGSTDTVLKTIQVGQQPNGITVNSVTNKIYVSNNVAGAGTISIISVPAAINLDSSLPSRSPVKIPEWIKNNAKWWAENQTGDSDFVKGIQYLIQQAIVKIPKTQSSSSLSHEIPTWVKNNAKWWAQGEIDDSDFVSGIQYLVQAEIIRVEPEISECDQSLWDHVYNPDRLEIIDKCKTVSGIIQSIRAEKDGDYHIGLNLDPQYADLINEENIQNQNGNLVVEVICQRSVTQEDAIQACQNFTNYVEIPPVGSHVSITGSYVLDNQHGRWAEIHPVTKIQIIK